MSTDPTQPTPPAPQPARAPSWLMPFAPLILRLAAIAAAAALGAIGTYFGVPAKEVEKRVEVLVPFLDEFSPPPGWVNDPEEAQAVAAQMPTPRFAATPAGLVAEGDLPKAVYLWKAEQKLTGKATPLKDQNPTGSCVGFGTTTAIERTLAADIAARRGDPTEFTHFSEEVTYAGSRVEVNGGKCPIRPTRADPSGDGSMGAWAAKWATKWGMVPKGKYEGLDLREYSAARARSWNYSGVPDALEPVARKFPVKDATRITNWTDAKKSLASTYAIAVCSGQGFTRVRDSRGVARASGSWQHCMCIDGYHTDEAGNEYGHIENSWSNLPDQNGNRTGKPYHTGPVGWGEPTTAGFWADAAVIDRMLREGDSWAFSGATGFPRKALPLDWFVQAEPKPFWKLRHDIERERFALAW